MRLEDFVINNNIEKFYVVNTDWNRMNLIVTKNWKNFKSYHYWKNHEVISVKKGDNFFMGTNGFLIVVN